MDDRSRTSLSNISGSVTANRRQDEGRPVGRLCIGAGGEKARAVGHADRANAAVAAVVKAHRLFVLTKCGLSVTIVAAGKGAIT